jgi:hypothetical protein
MGKKRSVEGGKIKEDAVGGGKYERQKNRNEWLM